MTSKDKNRVRLPSSEQVRKYLANVISDLGELGHTSGGGTDAVNPEITADSVFRILTARRFCYLSRRRVERYKDNVLTSLRNRMSRNESFRFFYDIGPGYHATTRPGEEPLRFDVGLSELLILYQINSVCRQISKSYPAGACFWLVIDNLCALRTNDIPVQSTEDYVRQLRDLIAGVNMTEYVKLMVESEVIDIAEYDRRLEKIAGASAGVELSSAAVENVSRFLGRVCSEKEAAERIKRYQRTSQVTDALFDELIEDVHMTQRATGATMGFRPFPGGDQRTQAGELALSDNSKGKLKPTLLTSRNIDEFATRRYEFPDIVPSQIPYVLAAANIQAP